MDKQQLLLYAKKLRLSIFILALGLLICGILINNLVPSVKDFIEKNKSISQQTKSLADKAQKLTELKATMKQKTAEQSTLIKEFYKPIESGLDTESIMSEEFNHVLAMLRANSIKARSVKYDYNPSSDKFVKNASYKYNVCSLYLEMIADYKHYQAFLRDLYKHEHFLEISDIEIVPYEKDKKILLIKSNLKLYSQKTDADIAASPKPAAQPEETTNAAPETTNTDSKTSAPKQDKQKQDTPPADTSMEDLL